VDTRAPIRRTGPRSQGSSPAWRHRAVPASRRLLVRLRHDEEGVALVLALTVMSVLALTTSALLLDAVVNQRGSYSSTQDKQAFNLAQAALAYAEGQVYSAPKTHVAPPTGRQTLPHQPGGGAATFRMSVASDGATWTMSGTGTVDGVTKTVSAQAYVPDDSSSSSYALWNYLYADDTSGQATNTCETTIQGGVTVSVPVYVRDNLCITGGAHFTGSSLTVDGNLTVNGGANVGTASKKIDSVQVGGTPTASACTVGSRSAVTPGTSWCDGTHASLYANLVGASPPSNPGMPVVDFQGDYDTQAAQAQIGCPAGLLDNDGVLDNSVSSANLFPYSYYPTPLSYDCKVGTNELKWQQTSTGSSDGTLTINGTFYVDGSLSLGNGQNVLYNGKGTLYFTGGVTLAGGSSFCGIANCSSYWNTSANAIIVVARCWANSTGSALLSPGCVHIGGGADVQVGVLAETGYQIDGGGSNMGPVVAKNLYITGGSSTLIPFDQNNMPPGTPQTAHTPADPPSHWAG